jgi:hypothetical protein
MSEQPQSAENDARCSCGNAFDGDNFCMPSACQWEGLEPDLVEPRPHSVRYAPR